MAEVDLNPTSGMIAAFKTGLKLHEEGKSGKGLMPATVAWARRAVAGDSMSELKVRQMNAWFARHAVDKKPGWSDAGKETPGYVAWLLWGGDAGRSWAARKVAELDRAEE
jgi:hypothetical protein